MSFNVSRFLVRVRAFWTRERLVPVLGVTALLMFGLLSANYIKSFFTERPIVATAVWESHDGADFTHEHEFEVFTEGNMQFQLRHFESEEGLKKHKERLERLRRELERHRNNLEKHRDKLEKHRKFIFKSEDGTHEIVIGDEDDVNTFILKNDQEEEIKIEVNGEVVQIQRTNDL